MAHLEKNKRWRASIEIAGKRYTKRGFSSKRLAQIWENQIRLKYEKKELGLPTDDIEPIYEIMQGYIDSARPRLKERSLEREIDCLNNWRGYFLDKDISFCNEIRKDTYKDFIQWRKKKKPNISNATLNHDLKAIRKSFKWGVIEEKISKNPFGNIQFFRRKKQGLPKYLTREEIEKIENWLLENDKLDFGDCFAVLVRTGLRASELCSLTKKNIDLERKQIILFPEQTKAEKMRVVPMNEKVVEIMKKRLESQKDYIFTNTAGKQANRDFLWKRFKKALEKIDIEDKNTINVHTLRRTYVSHMAMAGIDPVKIMAIVGHEDWQTLKRYLALSPKYLNENAVVKF